VVEAVYVALAAQLPTWIKDPRLVAYWVVLLETFAAEKLPNGEKDTWVLQLEIDHYQKHVGRGLANGGYSPEKLWLQG
jgi:hypothetical protein